VPGMCCNPKDSKIILEGESPLYARLISRSISKSHRVSLKP